MPPQTHMLPERPHRMTFCVMVLGSLAPELIYVYVPTVSLSTISFCASTSRKKV
jgi:hypothetical protein